MKKEIILGLIAGILSLTACKETPITIPELSVGERKVLVEEITGVNCPNCPDGAAELAAQRAIFGENLIVVSIHEAPGVLNDPLPESQYDFHTVKGEQLAAFIDLIPFAPSAAINRVLPPSEFFLFLGQSSWGGVIPQEIAKPTPVGVFINREYNSTSRELNIDVRLTPDEDLTGEHRLTVLITQDSIVDAQVKGSQTIEHYLHRHVLRDVVTQPAGDVISEPLTAGALISKKYKITLPAEWEDKHCSIVAYIHRNGTPDKEVLQAEEVHVVE